MGRDPDRPWCYAEPEAWADASDLSLSAEEAHHLAKVLRVREGAPVTVFDGQGRYADARVVSISKQSARLELDAEPLYEAPLGDLQLAQSICRSERMEWILQKSVELGCTGIALLETTHGIAHLLRKAGEQKTRDRWQRILLSACKQSQNPNLPELQSPVPLREWVQSPCADACVSFAGVLRPETQIFGTYLNTHPYQAGQTCELVIGPEGDLTDAEIQAVLDRGSVPVSFGSLRMRTETAAVYGMSLLQSWMLQAKG